MAKTEPNCTSDFDLKTTKIASTNPLVDFDFSVLIDFVYIERNRGGFLPTHNSVTRFSIEFVHTVLFIAANQISAFEVSNFYYTNFISPKICNNLLQLVLPHLIFVQRHWFFFLSRSKQ